MKKNFRAILNIKGKTTTFAKSFSTVSALIKALNAEGIGMKNVVKFEEFDVLKEKRRGKIATRH
jgi:hypothetical protein